MIKMVFLIRSLDRGGAERQLVTLIQRMDKNRFAVTLVTFYSSDRLSAELAASRIPVVSLRKRGRWDLFGFLWRLSRELRKLRPDIVHSYLVDPNLVAVFIKPLLKQAKIVWGIRASNVELKHYDWFARLNFRLQVFFSRFADLIIFNSYAAREFHFARGLSARNTIVIHNGIDTEVFRSHRLAGESLRAEWRIDPSAILIGLVARLDPMKDHRTFIKAAGLVAQRHQEARFICVGGGPAKYLEQLRSLADENLISDRLVWLSQCDDMPGVYNAMDILCLSSAFGEGLPNAVAEAMACDVPCVVTDVGDAAVLVGDTGIVVPPNDPLALADGIKKCIDNLRQAQRPHPRQRIMQQFDLQRLVDQTEAALGGLM